MQRLRCAIPALLAACVGGALVGCGGDEPPQPPPAEGSAPRAAGEQVAPAAERDAQPAEPGGLHPALRARVLALPGIAPMGTGDAWRQRPAGAVERVSEQEAAGGARRLRLRVPVERRGSAGDEAARWVVIVDALVDAEGVPLRVVEVGAEDPEFLALFGE